MKIASVIMGFSSGGAETLVRNLCSEFVSQGHECCVIAVADAADLGNSVDFEAGYKAELLARNIDFVVLGSAARRNPFLGAARLRKAVQAYRPDILHIHTGHGLLSQALGLVTVPTIYTHHNIRMNFPPVLFRIFDRFVQHYVAICNACDVLLKRHTRKPVTLIFNGVPANFSRRHKRRTLPENPTVLSVGAVTPQKDYPGLVRAAALCVRHFADSGRTIRFKIAGSGPGSEELSGQIAAKGLGQEIELLGTRSDVPQLMAEADLLVNSSIYEGFPIALIEAAMSGLPAVATAVGGTPEIVIDGDTGTLVPPEDSQALAGAITDILSDRVRYEACSSAALVRSTRFTVEQCAEEHLQLYSSVIAQHEGSHRRDVSLTQARNSFSR